MKRFLIFLLGVIAISCSKDEATTELIISDSREYVLTVTSGKGGSVSTTGGSYKKGTKISITAIPEPDYTFKNWSNGSLENPIEIVLNSNVQLTANFEPRKYALSVEIEGQGTVTEEIINPGKGATDYEFGTTVKLTAAPAEGWYFEGWEGAIQDTSSSIELLIDQPKELIANFSEIPPNYEINIVGNGSYEESWEGGLRKLTAVPSQGWRFKSWDGDLQSLNKVILIETTATYKLTLTFILLEDDELAGLFPDQDYELLRNALNTLSSGWVQDQVDLANDIFLRNEDLDNEIWVRFFESYFSEFPMTADLLNYLQYPSFYWLSVRVHEFLQKSITYGLIARLGNTDLTNPEEENINAYKYLGSIIYLDSNELSNQDALNSFIYDFYTAHVNSYPKVLKLSSTITDRQELFLPIRFQVSAALAHYSFLYSGHKTEIASTLDISNTPHGSSKQRIWNNHNMLCIDNNFFNGTTLEVFESILDVVDRNYHHNVIFTAFDSNVIELDRQMPGYFNVFAIQVGEASENGFPEDVESYFADLTFLVFVHEINHGTDYYFIDRWNPDLRNFKEVILNQAGMDRMNYLRSMFDDGFFQNSPQEFFASISNMYFANTELTFEVAMKRYENGIPHPLNQFLFMARIYSGDRALFFNNDDNVLNIFSRSIEKNNSGFITSLEYKEKVYKFSLNPDNTVKSVTIE